MLSPQDEAWDGCQADPKDCESSERSWARLGNGSRGRKTVQPSPAGPLVPFFTPFLPVTAGAGWQLGAGRVPRRGCASFCWHLGDHRGPCQVASSSAGAPGGDARASRLEHGEQLPPRALHELDLQILPLPQGSRTRGVRMAAPRRNPRGTEGNRGESELHVLGTASPRPQGAGARRQDQHQESHGNRAGRQLQGMA